MFKNAHLIFNPISGQGNSSGELLFIQNSFEEAGVPLTLLETTPDKSANELAREAVANDADCVIASGGDGTVSAVAGELAFTEISLGIIPRGTANAIASAFGISDNIAAACHTILSGIPRTIDMASC
ncbi:MAG: diacylglycerol kinase family protein, partial [Cyanobacteria bacterium J06606_4]